MKTQKRRLMWHGMLLFLLGLVTGLLEPVLRYAFLVEFLPLYAQSCWTIGSVAPDRTYLACRGGASSTSSKTSAVASDPRDLTRSL
jgi:hypothetical protein